MEISPIEAAMLATIQRLQPEINHARQLLGGLALAEVKLRSTRDEMLSLGWQLGQVLKKLKEEVGHGRWIPFVEGQLPRLGVRDAQRCIQFFTDNPKCAESAHLTYTTESIRKFLWHTIPEKERPELEGDAPVARLTHHLTFVNVFSKWDRQLSLGRVAQPPQDVLRRECDPVVKRLTELCGVEWIIEQATKAAGTRG